AGDDPGEGEDLAVEQRDGDGDEHAGRAEHVAGARGRRRAEPLEPDDEERRGDEVGGVDEQRQRCAFGLCDHCPPSCRFLNIWSMRSVTMKPPTTLRVANATAATPITVLSGDSSRPATMTAPTRVMPEMALDPDISGVCRTWGTLVMTSNPTNMARTKTYSAMSRPSSMATPRKGWISRRRPRIPAVCRTPPLRRA